MCQLNYTDKTVAMEQSKLGIPPQLMSLDKNDNTEKS